MNSRVRARYFSKFAQVLRVFVFMEREFSFFWTHLYLLFGPLFHLKHLEMLSLNTLRNVSHMCYFFRMCSHAHWNSNRMHRTGQTRSPKETAHCLGECLSEKYGPGRTTVRLCKALSRKMNLCWSIASWKKKIVQKNIVEQYGSMKWIRLV